LQVKQARLGVYSGEVAVEEGVAGGADGDQAGPLGLAGGCVDGLDVTVEHDGLDQAGPVGLEQLVKCTHGHLRHHRLVELLTLPGWPGLLGHLVARLDVAAGGDRRDPVVARQRILDHQLA
jgi:hypothetical protein